MRITLWAATAATLLLTATVTWQSKPGSFQGASVARLTGERISYLREYATTAPLYDWTGTWRE